MVSRACSPAVLRPPSFFTARTTMVYRSASARRAARRAVSKSARLVVSPASVTSTMTLRRPGGICAQAPANPETPRHTAPCRRPGTMRLSAACSMGTFEENGAICVTASANS